MILTPALSGAVLVAALLSPPPGSPPPGPPPQDVLPLEGRGPADTARLRIPVARRALLAARGVLRGWWALRDPVTGLLPRRTDQNLWLPQDNAADLLPFLLLAARYTRPELLDELAAVYRAEMALTTRLGALPDGYSIPERRFLAPTPEIGRIVFGATEYAKDGLNPLLELLGPDPWSRRAIQLVEGVFQHAPVDSDFGRLPAGDTEVNGEMLQVLSRLHFLTGEERFMGWAERITDAYCLEVIAGEAPIPAHRWDFTTHRPTDDRFSLNDHGNEILGGLAEAYAAAHALGRPSAARWEAPLRRMFDTLLEKGRNADGLWYGLLEASTGRVLRRDVPDTWGYGLTALYTFGVAAGEPRYLEAVRQALVGIDQERYLEWGGADSFADSIEGALLLLARVDEPAARRWLERVLPRFFAQQKLPSEGGTGIVEGWYGDGNYARTALMVAFFCTRGAWLEPWDESLGIGAARDGQGLHLELEAGVDWHGRLHLDHPRHRDHLRLPHDLPRLNMFPEWYTVEPAQLYELELERRRPGGEVHGEHLLRLGSELIGGLSLELAAGDTLSLRIAPAGAPPHGTERGPLDPLAALADGPGDPALLAAIDLATTAVPGERYAGEDYAWTGRGPILWRPRPEVGATDATLWLRWGSKGDRRRARVEVGGHARDLERGGWDGFDWVAVDVPASWWTDGELAVRVESSGGPTGAAFLSAMRLRRARLRPDPGAFLWSMEAEELEGGWDTQTNVGGYRGAGFRVSNAVGLARTALSGTVPFPAGTAALWVRALDGDGQDRRLALVLDGEPFEPTHRWRWRGGGEGGAWRWQLAGTRDLAAGARRLEVRDAGIGCEVVDALLITSDLAFDPGRLERIERTLAEPLDTPDPVDRLVAECAARAEAAHDRGQATGPRLAAALGLAPSPPSTPLAARTLGVLQRDGYRIERVVFESRPGFPVTANLYLPDPLDSPGPLGAGPAPAVLCPVGHWGGSKEEPVVQARCIGLAKLGYVALTYDPFGQGERAVEGNDHGEYFRSILVGFNNLSFMVWDTLRALDYLEARAEVDPGRIACSGASGGGLNTLYAAALDPRIRVAVPVVYLTRLREFLETRHTHCPCSHVNGLVRFADMGDVAGLVAPRPLLAITAARDGSFTPAGARAALDQARPAYQRLGAGEALELVEFDGTHDFDRPMREALYGFLARHLLGRGDGAPVAEPPLSVEPDGSVLHCFPSGRVPAGSETVRSLARARARDLVGVAPRKGGAAATRRALAAALEEPPADPATADLAPTPGPLRATPRPLDPGLVGLLTEPGAVGIWDTSEGIPMALHPDPGAAGGGAGGGGTLVLVLSEEGDSSPLARLARTWARRVITLDPRGIHGGRHEHLLATDAHLSGDPLVFRRARALGEVARALRQVAGDEPLVALAEGARPSLVLLLAQAGLDVFDGIGLAGLQESLVEAFDGPLPPPDLYAWRLLELGDLPAFIAAAGVPVTRLEEGGETGAVPLAFRRR